MIAGTGASTVTRLAIGSDGTTLVANSSASTGVSWSGPTFIAGKNKIINGDFGIWQRGTSFTSSGYTADRWTMSVVGTTGTYSQQSFTVGNAITGYEPIYYMQAVTSSVAGAGNYTWLRQLVENVQTLAGQTVTLSFWAKASSALPISLEIEQNFGSGGSSSVDTFIAKPTLSTSWTRYSFTFTIPSISGKTVGTSSFSHIAFWLDAGSNFNSRTSSLGQQSGTFQFWGVQLEAGSVASPFTTATGTIQGELAACQRYLPSVIADGTTSDIGSGFCYSTTNAYIYVPFKVTPRVAPTGVTVSSGTNFAIRNISATAITSTSVSINAGALDGAGLIVTVASGLVAGNGTTMLKGTTAYLLFTGCEL